MHGMDGGTIVASMSVLGISCCGAGDGSLDLFGACSLEIGAVVFALGEACGSERMAVTFQSVETIVSPRLLENATDQLREGDERELLMVCAHRLGLMAAPVIMVPGLAVRSFDQFRIRSRHNGTGLRWRPAGHSHSRFDAIQHWAMTDTEADSSARFPLDQECPIARAECLALRSWIAGVDHLSRLGRISACGHSRTMDSLYEVLLTEQDRRPHWAAWLRPH